MGVVVAKLGSAIVADEEGAVRRDVLACICEQVAEQRKRDRQVVIVTSGAIAIGMRAMALPVRPSAMDELQAASAVGQGRLYREYEQLLTEAGLRSAQVLLTFFDMSARTHYLNARQTLRRLLAWDVVPVINENDTTTTDEISFGDNDFLAAQVAILLQAEELLLFTDTDGLYTADPRHNPAAELIAEVSEFEALEALQIGVSNSRIA
jgi:glutamate 5-kinase